MRLINLEWILPILVVLPLGVSLLLFFIRNYLISTLITIFTCIFIFIISVYLLFASSAIPISYFFGNFLAPFGIEYRSDILKLFFIILISFVALISSIYQKKSILLESNLQKPYFYNPIFLLALCGSIGIVITEDAFNLFVFLEILSLSTYILIALHKNKESSLASFNYLIIGTIAASFYVFGLGILYLLLGTLNIEDIINKLYNYQPNNLLYFAIALICSGIFIKIGLFPLFFWLPSSYKNLITPALAFIGGTSFKVAIYMFLKIVVLMIGKNQYFNLEIIFNIVIILSICSILYGSILIFKQNDLKLFFAFSSISHIGYIMLGVGIFSQLSIMSSFYQLLTHSIDKVGVFLCIGIIYLYFKSINIDELKGSLKHKLILFIPFVYFSLSLVGMPGTAGFWGKFSLIYSLVYSPFRYIIAILLFSSVLAFIYAWRLILTLYGYNLTDKISYPNEKSPFYMYLAIYILMFTSIILAFNPNFAFYMAEQIISFVILPTSE